MENNKAYLKQFGPVFLIIVPAAILFMWMTEQLTGSDYTETSLLLILFQLLPLVLIMINIGIVTKKWTAAVGGLVAYVIAEALQYFLLKNYKEGAIGPGIRMLFQILIYFLPFIIFFLVDKTDSKKLPGVLLGILLLLGTNGLYTSQEGFTWLMDLLDRDWKISKYIFSFLVIVVGQIVHIILICELINYAQGKNNGLRARIINPGNEYNKANATIIFWVLKTFLYLSMLGCVAMLRSYISFFGDYYGQTLSYLKWYYLLSLITTTFLMLATAWYLRKFMLEFFISYNFSSRFLYWFLLLPVLGFFAWLVMLADSDKRYSFKERKKTLEDFSSSSPKSIITVFVILLVLRFLLIIASAQFASILSLLISVVLFVALISSTGGYYFNLYLNLVLLAFFFLLPLVKINADLGALLFPLLLMNVVQIVLIFPALHFEAFDYLSYEEEEEPWQPGQDLF